MIANDLIKMPVVFLGHGSPLNALAENSYTHALNQLENLIPKPRAILCISAHWQTKGTYITSSDQPKQIYDFYGFPEELYQVKYSPKGSRDLALDLQTFLGTNLIQLDSDHWGLDHGSWSVLKHIYPKADVPVLQLSLNVNKTPSEHFEFGKQLSYLRNQGVLILGSGNVVHNLRTISWNEKSTPLTWANEYHEWIKKNLTEHNWPSLVHDFLNTSAAKLSVPTLEHYLPLLYIIGAAHDSKHTEFVVDEIQNASISMLSFILN